MSAPDGPISSPTRRDPLTRLAWGIGYLINPLVLPPLFFGWLTGSMAWPSGAVWKATGLAALFLGLLPLITVLVLIAFGGARTLEVRDRAKRTPAFLAAVGFGVGAVLAAAWLEWPQQNVLPALLAVFPINSALLAAINQRTKISVHSASVTAFASMGLWSSVAAGLPAALPAAIAVAAPAVMWARVRDQAHTVRQVLLGALFGILVPAAELYLFTAVGWLRFA